MLVFRGMNFRFDPFRSFSVEVTNHHDLLEDGCDTSLYPPNIDSKRSTMLDSNITKKQKKNHLNKNTLYCDVIFTNMLMVIPNCVA